MGDIGIGAVLQEARTEQQRSLAEAASATSMRVVQVEAMEDDRFEVFGGDVYAKGFLRSYARWLELDPEPLLDRYRRYVQHDRSDQLAFAPSGVRPDEPSDVPMWLLRIVAVAAVVGLGIVLVQLVSSRVPTPADEPTVAVAPDPVETTSSAPTEAATASPTPSPTPTPTFEGVELTLAFEGDSYIIVTIDGQTTQEGLFEAGDVLDLEGEDEIVVRFGDAGVVSSLLNGQRFGPFGATGEVLNIRYTPDGAEQV